MSYLRGPLTLPQLADLPGNTSAQTAPQKPTATQPAPQSDATPQPAAVAPVVPPDIPVFHLRPPQTGDDGTYTPTLVATYKLHFVDAKAAVDKWISRTWLVPFAATTGEPLWDAPVLYETANRDLTRDTPAQASYAALPASVTRPKALAAWTKSLAAALYQNATLDLHAYPELKMVSRPDEPLGDFRVRVCQILRERHDEQVAKLKAKYAPTLRTLSDQIRRAEAKVERERRSPASGKWTRCWLAPRSSPFSGAGVADWHVGRRQPP